MFLRSSSKKTRRQNPETTMWILNSCLLTYEYNVTLEHGPSPWFAKTLGLAECSRDLRKNISNGVFFVFIFYMIRR
jgi:hypothetical protein